MKTLFIYYSYTGNGDLVAEYFREKGAEIRKVSPKKSLPKSFLLGMLTGGFLASVKHKSPLLEWDSSLEGYDQVIVGSPVWNGRISSPINSVLEALKGKELSFVLYAGGGAAPKAVEQLEKEFPSSKIVVLKEPKKLPEEREKLQVFFD